MMAATMTIIENKKRAGRHHITPVESPASPFALIGCEYLQILNVSKIAPTFAGFAWRAITAATATLMCVGCSYLMVPKGAVKNSLSHVQR